MFILLLITSFVLANAREETYDDLIQSIQSIVERKDQVDDDAILQELRNLFEDQGIDFNKVMTDISFISGIPGIFTNGDARRWSSLNFARQTACYQGKTGSLINELIFSYTTYVGYGCYCGGGHYRGNYLDQTDLCCKHHDLCYGQVSQKYGLKQGCHTYTTSYSMSCCEDKKITKCTDTGPSASRALCDCDQEAAKCLASKAAKSSYNAAYMKNRSQCQDHPEIDTKVLSAMDILKTCKHILKPTKTFYQTIRSQGKCPKTKTSSWFWAGNLQTSGGKDNMEEKLNYDMDTI
ncbi:uncharacterized protein LOC120330387 [Styela clava]